MANNLSKHITIWLGTLVLSGTIIYVTETVGSERLQDSQRRLAKVEKEAPDWAELTKINSDLRTVREDMEKEKRSLLLKTKQLERDFNPVWREIERERQLEGKALSKTTTGAP